MCVVCVWGGGGVAIWEGDRYTYDHAEGDAGDDRVAKAIHPLHAGQLKVPAHVVFHVADAGEQALEGRRPGGRERNRERARASGRGDA